jgi:hypothetical protein
MPPQTSAARAPVPLDGAELPPLVYDPPWARPIKTQGAGFWNGHWIGFVFLLPFVVILVVHEFRGMSDALFAGNDPRDDDARLYNLLMLVALFLGSLAFVIYAFALPIVTGRGWRWILPRLIFLAFYWGAYMVVSYFLVEPQESVTRRL